MSQQNLTNVGEQSQQVLHVKQDSETDMDQLFAVLQQNVPNAQTPFAQRKLPASFFTPPKINHSRDNSADGATHLGLQRGPGGLPIAHGRSRSSPAMLPNTLSALNAPPQNNHLKQQSLGDFSSDDFTLGPLPPGWGIAKTADGQRYFLK